MSSSSIPDSDSSDSKEVSSDSKKTKKTRKPKEVFCGRTYQSVVSLEEPHGVGWFIYYWYDTQAIVDTARAEKK